MGASWRLKLRAARQNAGISQREVATRARVSTDTVRSYESGRRRHPSPRNLEAIIAALKIPNAAANEIRESAGFAPLRTVFDGELDQNFYYTTGELDPTVGAVPWPEFVLNDALEVVAANAATEAVWRIDFEHERKTRTRAQMNLLAVASANEFGARLKNWDECVGVLVSIAKSNRPEPLSLDHPQPYFKEVLNEFLNGDPAFLSRLLDVWSRAEARESKVRWTYPVVWDDTEVGEMRFLATVSLANLEHSTFFNDWIPLDADTWGVLERVKTRAAGRRTG